MNLRSSFRSSWRSLPVAQRRLLAGGLGVAALLALVLLDMLPALDAVRQGPARLQRLQQQAGAMQDLQVEVTALRLRPRLDPGDTARRFTEATQQLLGPAARITPQGDALQVELTGVTASGLAQWLAMLRPEAGATVTQTRLQRDDKQLWNGTVTLRTLSH